MRLAEMTWPELRTVSRDATLLMAPLGSCEQHGPHLPALTDTLLVTAVAEAVERQRADRVLLLPTLWLGASEHHLAFGATLTTGPALYADLLAEAYASLLREGFQRLFLLNGHGGNVAPMQVALRELKGRFPHCLVAGASYWEIASSEIASLCEGPRKEIGHACEIETSLMLWVWPELVRRGKSHDEASPEPRGVFLAASMAERTVHGVVGYPSLASREKGEKLLEGITGAVVRAVDELLRLPLPADSWSPRAPYRLT
jgi:creatinine amidohydrolase